MAAIILSSGEACEQDDGPKVAYTSRFRCCSAHGPDRETWRPSDWILGTAEGQWAILLSVASCLVLTGSFCWHLTGGNQEYNDSFEESLWIAWGLFFDPGTQTGIPAKDPGKVKFVAVLFSITGFVFNLAVLGLVVDMIRGRLRHWKELRSRVVANGHVLVLGWGDKTLFLLSELIAGQEKIQASTRAGCCRRCCARFRKRTRIVVLAQKSALEMRQEVRMHLRYFHGLPDDAIVYRDGDPTDRTELMKVCAHTAQDILIMGSRGSGGDSDSMVIQSMLALASLPQSARLPGDIFADVQSQESSRAVRHLLPSAEAIRARNVVQRILVLRTLASTVGFCYLDFTSFQKGNELYLRPVAKDLIGKSFAEACLVFPDAVLCGVVPTGRYPGEELSRELIPLGSQPLQDGDQLLMLAPSHEAADHWKDISQDDAVLPETPKCSRFINDRELLTAEGQLKLAPSVSGPKVVIVFGCPVDIPGFLEIVDLHLASGSVLHLLSRRSLDWRRHVLKTHFGCEEPEERGYFQHIRVEHHIGSAVDIKAMKKLPLSQADFIMILSDFTDDATTPLAVDSRNLSTVINLRDLLPVGEGGGRKLSSSSGRVTKKCKVVTELLDPKSLQVVEGNNNIRALGSFVYSAALETGVFAMAAGERGVYNVLRRLLTPCSGAGHIVAAPVSDYVAGNECLSFRNLQGRVWNSCGGILLGWRRKQSRYPELNPEHKARPLEWRDDVGDELLVLRPHIAPENISEDTDTTIKSVSRGLIGCDTMMLPGTVS